MSQIAATALKYGLPGAGVVLIVYWNRSQTVATALKYSLFSQGWCLLYNEMWHILDSILLILAGVVLIV